MSDTATIDPTDTKRPYSPRTRTLHDVVVSACEHLRQCEAELAEAQNEQAAVHARCDAAMTARTEAERQLKSYVEAVMSDVFSPTFAARICRHLGNEKSIPF